MMHIYVFIWTFIFGYVLDIYIYLDIIGQKYIYMYKICIYTVYMYKICIYTIYVTVCI